MRAITRTAALWWLAVAVLFVFLYGLASLIARFPPHEHRLAYALFCLVSLFAVTVWMEVEQAPARGAR